MLKIFKLSELKADASLASNSRTVTLDIIWYLIQILLYRSKPAIKQFIIPGYLKWNISESFMPAG